MTKIILLLLLVIFASTLRVSDEEQSHKLRCNHGGQRNDCGWPYMTK
jgi:hypothetical protein